jgi:hypothetical protein
MSWTKEYVEVAKRQKRNAEEREKKHRMDADGDAKRHMAKSGIVLDVAIEDAEFVELPPLPMRGETINPAYANRAMNNAMFKPVGGSW